MSLPAMRPGYPIPAVGQTWVDSEGTVETIASIDDDPDGYPINFVGGGAWECNMAECEPTPATWVAAALALQRDLAALRAEVELLKERIDLCPECAGGGIDDAGRPCDCKATGDVLMLVANLRTERDAAVEALAASTARAERAERELERVRGTR